MPFLPKKPKRVIWRPTCRENAPDPGSSFLGSLLNADPIGNAQQAIDFVNPLNMNPLNGLASITSVFSGFRATVQNMGPNIRRMGLSIMRSDPVRRIFESQSKGGEQP